MMYRQELLISERRIQRRIRILAQQINSDYRDEKVDVVCVLKGGLFFAADLSRHLTVPLQLHFIQASSYGEGSEPSGTIRIHYSSIPEGLSGHHILLVEDIVDTGITLDYLLRHLSGPGPRSLRTCALLSKPSRRRLEVPLDYVGFEIPDEFVIGYGLDYREFGRNLRYIAVLDRSEYQK
jgi:hypoxanthine phosphoribosyltransferase